jgi:hypothetical protein
VRYYKLEAKMLSESRMNKIIEDFKAIETLTRRLLVQSAKNALAAWERTVAHLRGHRAKLGERWAEGHWGREGCSNRPHLHSWRNAHPDTTGHVAGRPQDGLSELRGNLFDIIQAFHALPSRLFRIHQYQSVKFRVPNCLLGRIRDGW